MTRKVFCNPLNLEYHYQLISNAYEQSVFREMADPTLTLFKDTYYLFASMNGGFYYSDDLFTWNYKATPELPIYDYAPDVREVAGELVFCASHKDDRGAQLWKSPDPLNVPFELVSEPFDFWDPDLFCDDDGRVYLYWGSSTTEPLYGQELDAKTLLPIGKKQVFFGSDTAAHGWERKGENNYLGEPKTKRDRMVREMLGTNPWIEGVYMSKHEGRYYLQYAGNGTNFNTYCDGVYVSDKPLGPFEYQRHNPFSSAPGGFMPGAGHGSTFCDKQGNWWHVSTLRISVNGAFERRIGLWPCYFDEAGTMHCNQDYSCFPQVLPKGKAVWNTHYEPTMMLLSYGAEAQASSQVDGHDAELACDENCQTWWVASTDDSNPWLQIDLGTTKHIEAFQINFADHEVPMPGFDAGDADPTDIGAGRMIVLDHLELSYRVEGSADGESWTVLHNNASAKTDLSNDFIVMARPAELRYLRISNIKVPMDAVPAISGFRVFGHADIAKPSAVESATVTRSDDGLDAHLSWEAAEGAVGHNVCYGLSEDTLYSSWEVDGANELKLTTLNATEKYFARIDSFNEAGVTFGKVFEIA